MPTPVFVNSTTSFSTAGVQTPTVPIPSGVVPGDRLIAVLVYGGTDASPTLPSGWDEIEHQDFEANGFISIVTRTMSSGLSAPVWTLTPAAIYAKYAAAMVAYRGDDGIVSGDIVVRDTVESTTVAPAITTSENDALVVGIFGDRVSNQTTVTAPTEQTERAKYITSGGGGVSVLISDEVYATAGSTGTRTATYGVASVNGAGILIELSPGASAAPTVNAGADAMVTAGTTFSRTASASAASPATISSRSWTQQSGPASPTITGATTATMSVTPTVTGTYVYRHTVTDSNGATAFDEFILTVTGEEARPDGTVTNPGNYIVVGDDISHAAALADESDSTYIESPDSGVGASITMSMSPLDPGNVTVTVKARSSTEPVATMRTQLMEGNTVIASWDDVTTTSFATYTHTTTSQQTSTINSFNDLRVRLIWQS